MELNFKFIMQTEKLAHLEVINVDFYCIDFKCGDLFVYIMCEISEWCVQNNVHIYFL